MLYTQSSLAKGTECLGMEPLPGLSNIAPNRYSSWPVPLPITGPFSDLNNGSFQLPLIKMLACPLDQVAVRSWCPWQYQGLPQNLTVSSLIFTSVPQMFPWMGFASLSKTEIHRDTLLLSPVAGPVLSLALLLSACISQSCSPEQRINGTKGYLKEASVHFSENSPTWRNYQNSFSLVLTG